MPESLVVRGLSCAAIYELSPISSLGWASALSGLYRRRLLLGLAQRDPLDRWVRCRVLGEPGQVERARERRIPKPPLPDRAAQLEDERAVLELLDASSTASRSARQKTGQQAGSFSTQKSQSGVIAPMGGHVMTDDAEPVSLADPTVEIVSAYVAHNQIAASDLPKVISTVAGALRTLGQEPRAAVPNKPEPIVSVRSSVRPDHLVCLMCGKKQKLLKRHLAVEHELTPSQYREAFGLKPDYPMAAPGYAQQRRELALSIGLGRPKKPMRRRRRKAALAEGAPGTEA